MVPNEVIQLVVLSENSGRSLTPRAKLISDIDRTLSIHVTESQQRSTPPVDKHHVKEVVDLEWHLLTRDEALQRLNVSQKVGLDSEIAARRLKQNGPNQVTPHRPNVYLK